MPMALALQGLAAAQAVGGGSQFKRVS